MMTKRNNIKINGTHLKISDVVNLVKHNHRANLSSEVIKKAKEGQILLKKTLESGGNIVYGINTGFGPMANYILPKDQLLELQKNLIISHATGVGKHIPHQFVNAAMLVRLNTLSKGHSAVSPELLNKIKELINHKIIPCVPRHGAVGTSGDLVQLAHIGLTIIGKGHSFYQQKIYKTSDLFKKLNISSYTLKAKEGLALINGTSMMSGIASLVCHDSKNLLSLSTLSGALALETINAYEDSFNDRLHQLRPHIGQITIAKKIQNLLSDSKLIRNRKILRNFANKGEDINKISESVQEIYSFRCIAQILGPVYQTLLNAWQVTEIEINSVTDNPVIDWKTKTFLHGGNFHGDYIAVAMDQLKMSLVKTTILSERRLNFLLNNKINGIFPPFLNLARPGLTLGLQPLQFVATSTTAHSQTLAYPMNLHSISTNGDNQDVVSMGTDAALITNEVLENAFIVQAIEIIALCQAIDFLGVQHKLAKKTKELYDFTRKYIKKIVNDREMAGELENFVEKLKNWDQTKLFEKL